MSQSYPEQRDNILLSDHQITSNGTILNRRTSEYPISSKESAISELSKKIAILNEKMDMFTVHMDDLSSKISCKSSQENLALQSEVCNGSASTSEFLSGAGNRKLAQNSSSYSQLPKDSPLMKEANDVVFCGRIIMFLAHFFPLSERSTVNIKGVFNTSNETKYEKEAPDGFSIDFNFYKTLWNLQGYYSNPASVTSAKWTKFSSNLGLVFDTFEPQPLCEDDGNANNVEETSFSIKYLTSSKLMGLEVQAIYIS